VKRRVVDEVGSGGKGTREAAAESGGGSLNGCQSPCPQQMHCCFPSLPHSLSPVIFTNLLFILVLVQI
jgi:hypothetical protein